MDFFWKYELAGCPERALEDKYWRVRLEAYRTLGFSEKALEDEDSDIRREAYRTLGFSEKAFDDPNQDIRLEAYRTLGFTEKAFDDPDQDIRMEAKAYIKAKELLGKYPNLEDLPPLLTSEDEFLRLYAETRLNKGM